MEEAVRTVPDAAVQETSFEDDVPAAGSRQDAEAARPSYAHNALSRLTTTTTTTTTCTTRTSRALAPDVLRGLLMVLMALDHNSMLGDWPRETAPGGEVDGGAPLHAWAATAPYVVRLLAHLWPPGLVFLLGAGVVYYGRSRRASGWAGGAIAGHFVGRALVLAAAAVVVGLVLTQGRVWVLNRILVALAVDYLVAGLLWLGVTASEETLAFWLVRVLPDADGDDAREPLLASRRGHVNIAPDRKIMRAADMSWHLHNLLVVALAGVAIWWNIWLSPTQGRCGPPDQDKLAASSSAVVVAALPRSSWFRFWFYRLSTRHVVSEYPPLAWLSFAILGLVYGRVVLARPWTRTAFALGNALAGLAFLALFVLTRLLHFGNLSEGCLQMPEHTAHPGTNQYLASWQSFLYLVRYPPDVAFWAFGVGCNLLLLAALGALPALVASTLLHPLTVYGTSALFFYMAHQVLLSLSVLFWAAGLGLGDREWVFWLNWALLLVLLYPACRLYNAFKKTKGPDSIWRFF